MESQNPPPQTHDGYMEISQAPSISALLANPSIDHFGVPIPVEYPELWITKASANRKTFGRLSEDDIDAIHRVIAPAAVEWEMKYGTIYTRSPGPIDDRHWGLQGAKVVPVRLNLPAGASIGSFAGDKALRNHDFTALSQTGLPGGDRPQDLIRWRLYDSRWRRKISYPSEYIVWEDPDSGKLYAQIPRPLEGMSRTGCDHCRIHDPDHAGEFVEYFDDRRHVGEFRTMSSGDTAVTPFNLCRFHWWYVWSGELLRQSQIHALELFVSGDLLERWGISHMRDFLLFMGSHFSTAYELRADDLAGRRPPGPGPARGAWLNTIGRADLEELENSNLPNAQGATAPNTHADQSVPGGQPASATTADGPDGTKASDQSTVEPASPGLIDAYVRSLKFYLLKLGFEKAASDLGKLRSPRQVSRQAVFGLPMRASRRRGVSLPKATSFLDGFPALILAQENNGLAIRRANGDSQPMNESGASSSAANSMPAPESAGTDTDTVGPAERPRTNGQSTPAPNYTSPAGAGVNGVTASQANGLAPSRTVAAVPHPQTKGTPASRNDGFLRSPPIGPRAWLKNQAK
ncbi:hypothetical protein INS49_006926 [Diaporthe citri]|uniref:uncharacterized protein n=1 Tax=Diaporthe citri TaxID=83186 RepID=UPI001C7F60CB|nr:uncharacterized protein INS49_006926 [Diaporthe citri]KAG6365317.1 hypothetical protein INS49_006926 [Diaporthe citri]